MNKPKSLVIIISILWISIITSLYRVANYNAEFVFGIVGLTIVTITYKKFQEFSFGILALLMFLSIFNVVTFNYSFGLYLNIFSARLSIQSIILFCFLFFTQLEKFIDLRQSWFNEDKAEIQHHRKNRIKSFKNNFQKLSESELRRKLENERLVEEAITAINELLNERTK